MPIQHDAYVFDPDKFMQSLAPYEKLIQQGPEGYARLRAAALAIYDREPRVSFMAADYGNWDRHKLETQWSADKPQGFYEVAFWIQLLLYNQLTTRPHALGLGLNSGRFEQALLAFGWEAKEANALVRGHRFLDMARQFHGGQALGFWHYLAPPVTTGALGWLGPKEVQWYKSLLFETRPRFTDLPPEMVFSHEQLQDAYRQAMKMLGAAEEAKGGLCMIVTGSAS